jgi:hypothetical protein
MEHGIKNGTTNIHVSRTKLNKIPPGIKPRGLFFYINYSVGSSTGVSITGAENDVPS